MWLALLLAVSLARPAAPSDDAAVLLERIAELAAEPSPEAESELVRLLAHDDFEVVSEAAAALRTCADRKGRRALEERVTDGPTPAIRRAALRSLFALDGDDGIDGLLRDLKGSFVPDALEALAQVAQETPELGPQPRLADFTRSRDVQVRTAARQAAVALDRTGDGLTALLEDDDPRVTAAVAGAAARWPQPAHFEACLAALADDALWPPTRRRLARAAAAALRAGGDEVLPSLPRLEGHSALALGSALASGKASSRDVELAGRLTTEGLRAQDPQVRALAARTLGRLGAAGAAERLGNTLVDPVDAVRLAAATAVATTLRGPRATPLLAPRIQTDDDPMVRTACALGLGQRDNLPAIGPLANALGSSDWRTSCAAALAIGRIESEGSVGPLRTYARFRAADRYRAAAATIGLGTTGRREVLAELVDALESQHPLQAACAFSVLRRQATAPADLDEGDLEEWYAWAEERVEATTESALPFDVLAVPSRLFVHGERARATV
ncbi:MAG: HEAT repeat domain-containing protein, partial [Planctomycetota bacterium]